jgi:hypothetical protein
MTTKHKEELKNEIVQTAFRLPKHKLKQLKLIALQHDMSVNELLIEGIDYIFKKYSASKKEAL